MKETDRPSYLGGADLSDVKELEHLIDYYQKATARSYNKVRELEVALQESTHQLQYYYQILEKLHKLHEEALRGKSK